jgi:prepilin-type N-terminal cleavage/methylation domain-containing protein
MQRSASRVPGFTLIEIMIVVGIMGLVLTMGVPIAYKAWHRAPMSQAVTDVVRICSTARAQAIMQGKEVDVMFHPLESRLEVSGAAAPPRRAAPDGMPPDPFGPPAGAVSAPASSDTAARLPDKVFIQMLDINKIPHKYEQDELARVRFFPNGTSDEMTLILNSDRNEQHGIALEVSTGLATVLSQTELQQLLSGGL